MQHKHDPAVSHSALYELPNTEAREKSRRRHICIVAEQVHGPQRPRDLDRADHRSSQGLAMTCSKERLVHGRGIRCRLCRRRPHTQCSEWRDEEVACATAYGRCGFVAQGIARDGSLDGAKHAVSKSTAPVAFPAHSQQPTVRQLLVMSQRNADDAAIWRTEPLFSMPIVRV
jgi:hypothetical protein